MIDLPALFDDVSTGFLKSLGGGAVRAYWQRRKDEAREVWLEEVRKANITAAAAASEDDVIGAMFRFERAVLEGTARLNLRLMAKALAGRLQLGTLVADEFLLYADALAALSRDEIILLATMRRCGQGKRGGDFWKAREALQAAGWSDDRATGAAARAQRSGFVYSVSPQGILTFQLTEMFVNVLKTVDFDDALRAEGVGGQ